MRIVRAIRRAEPPPTSRQLQAAGAASPSYFTARLPGPGHLLRHRQEDGEAETGVQLVDQHARLNSRITQQRTQGRNKDLRAANVAIATLALHEPRNVGGDQPLQTRRRTPRPLRQEPAGNALVSVHAARHQAPLSYEVAAVVAEQFFK